MAGSFCARRCASITSSQVSTQRPQQAPTGRCICSSPSELAPRSTTSRTWRSVTALQIQTYTEAGPRADHTADGPSLAHSGADENTSYLRPHRIVIGVHTALAPGLPRPGKSLFNLTTYAKPTATVSGPARSAGSPPGARQWPRKAAHLAPASRPGCAGGGRPAGTPAAAPPSCR
jgi:hypothetical protein